MEVSLHPKLRKVHVAGMNIDIVEAVGEIGYDVVGLEPVDLDLDSWGVNQHLHQKVNNGPDVVAVRFSAQLVVGINLTGETSVPPLPSQTQI